MNLKACWRRGIMSEDLREVLLLGFSQLGLVRIQAFVSAENVASKELLKNSTSKKKAI